MNKERLKEFLEFFKSQSDTFDWIEPQKCITGMMTDFTGYHLEGICRVDEKSNPLWIIEHISGKKYALQDVYDFSLSVPIHF